MRWRNGSRRLLFRLSFSFPVCLFIQSKIMRKNGRKGKRRNKKRKESLWLLSLLFSFPFSFSLYFPSNKKEGEGARKLREEKGKEIEQKKEEK